MNDVTRRLMTDMDPDLLTFLHSKVTSFVKWDLIRFFHENPHTADTAENIARYAGRNVEMTEAELVELTELGVLVKNQLGSMVVYSLSNDPGIRDLIRRFAEASDDREFRRKAIYHIIRGMR
ncbi:MAG: hypothetical protein JW900_02560 [Anaerolineae bacterium]|nr:hypothetical protein [Anaerolineae bacterium]